METPLQPLYDNLDSYTYEVFERDPVKYKLYQDAITRALEDRVLDAEVDSKVVNSETFCIIEYSVEIFFL